MTRPRQLPIDEDRKIRARQIVRRLKKGYPVALCALDDPLDGVFSFESGKSHWDGTFDC